MPSNTTERQTSQDRAGNFRDVPPTPKHLEFIAVDCLKPNPRNARTHSKKQIRQIATSIEQFGFNNPILVDDAYEVIAGHGRLQAAKSLGLTEVPVMRLSHLSVAEKRAYVLADNKIALNAGWDSELLALELGELADLLPEVDLDLEITGFDTGEIDLVLSDHEDPRASQCEEDEVVAPQGQIVAKRGDIWQLDRHRLLCGDARDTVALAGMFKDQIAALVLTDPPYNVPIQGHVGGRGQTKHAEFAFASGEMSDQEFEGFLSDALSAMLNHIDPGALLYLFMDWRHIEILLAAGRKCDLSLKNICVWHKTTPGQGSFYRSAHELVAVFANRGEAPTNNVRLGKYGRNRTNVWTYPGVNTFQAGKGGDLTVHPTVKPVAMLAEAIKDASKRGEIVLDPFLGSGSTVLAAEKVGRRCYGVEYEPGYVDVAIRRWQRSTGKDAVLIHRRADLGDDTDATGSSFDELSASATPEEGAAQ